MHSRSLFDTVVVLERIGSVMLRLNLISFFHCGLLVIHDTTSSLFRSSFRYFHPIPCRTRAWCQVKLLKLSLCSYIFPIPNSNTETQSTETLRPLVNQTITATFLRLIKLLENLVVDTPSSTNPSKVVNRRPKLNTTSICITISTQPNNNPNPDQASKNA